MGDTSEDRKHRTGEHLGATDPGSTPIMLQFEFFSAWLKAHAKSDRGASLVEYALLVALIAVVCIVAVRILGQKANSSFSTTGSAIN